MLQKNVLYIPHLQQNQRLEQINTIYPFSSQRPLANATAFCGTFNVWVTEAKLHWSKSRVMLLVYSV